jgi:hypothetical protein
VRASRPPSGDVTVAASPHPSGSAHEQRFSSWARLRAPPRDRRRKQRRQNTKRSLRANFCTPPRDSRRSAATHPRAQAPTCAPEQPRSPVFFAPAPPLMACPLGPSAMPITTAQRNARRANPRRAPVIAAKRAPQPALRLSALFRPRASARPRPNARARGANRRRHDADTSAAPTQRLTPAVAPRLARRARDLGSLLGRFGVALCLAYGLLVGAQAFAAYVTTAPRFEAAQLLVKPTPDRRHRAPARRRTPPRRPLPPH